MARCIFVLALCLTFAVPFVWSRRVNNDNKVASADVAQQPQDGIEHSHPMSTIFVIGFDRNTDEAAVNKHFGAVGAIKDLYFQSQVAAVITYEESSAATQAVNELHETILEGQTRYVEVKLDDPHRESKGDKGKGKGKDKGKTKGSGRGWRRASGRTIFVTGFDFETDADALTNHFGTVGAIEDHHFQSKRSATITYVEASAAQQALTKLDGSTMSGQSRHVAVKLDDPRPAKGSGEDLKGSGKVAGTDSGRAIYVHGFDSGTDEAALEKHFGDVGTIESCYFQSKVGAVVTFVEAASAQRAVTELDGTTMTGQTRYVEVKLDNSLDKASSKYQSRK